jgi:hypothetical protein
MSDALARYRANYQVTTTIKALKRLQELGIDVPYVAQGELQIELTVLDFIEQACYAFLTSQGIPSLEQQYLIGFEKRLWADRLKYDANTYQANRTLLIGEYVTRGHDDLEDPVIMNGLDQIVEDAYTMKKTREGFIFEVFVGVMT